MTSLKTALFTLGCGAAVLSLAACDITDPLLRGGQYELTHVNHANLVAMAANPADLVRGTGESVTPGNTSTTAVDRLYNGKVKRLPQATLSGVGGGGAAAGE